MACIRWRFSGDVGEKLDTLFPVSNLEPIPVAAFDLIMAQRTITGSPTGSPVMMAKMLEFAARHRILPTVEHFPMSKINDAIAHLLAGKARYRVILDADFNS